MRQIIALLVALLMSGCSAFKTTPQPPPAPPSQAVEITRAQSSNLPRLGTISAEVRGSPDDVGRELAQKANAAGATYYLVQMVSDTVVPAMWYGSAILYGAPSASAARP